MGRENEEGSMGVLYRLPCMSGVGIQDESCGFRCCGWVMCGNAECARGVPPIPNKSSSVTGFVAFPDPSSLYPGRFHQFHRLLRIRLPPSSHGPCFPTAAWKLTCLCHAREALVETYKRLFGKPTTSIILHTGSVCLPIHAR